MGTTKLEDDFLLACQSGDLEVMSRMLGKGVSPNGNPKAPSYGKPLASALLFQQWQAAHFLLDNDADPMTAASELDEPIEYLQADRDGETGRLLSRILDGIESHLGVAQQKNSPGFSDLELLWKKPFYKACEFGHLEIARQIHRMWKPSANTDFRHSPVGWAAINDHSETVAWLIQVGFDHHCHRNDEIPPAVYAILGHSPKSLQALLRGGEDPNLMAIAHKFKMIRTDHLDDLPANPKYEIFSQGSLLHFCVIAVEVACVDVLLEAGADPTIRDSEDRTALILAQLSGSHRQAVLSRLAEVSPNESADPQERFRQAVLQGNTKAARMAIKAGAAPDVPVLGPFNDQAPAVLFAAEKGNIDLLAVLIDAGASIDVADEGGGDFSKDLIRLTIEEIGLDSLQRQRYGCGRTAYLMAAAEGQLETMKWLADRGANLNVVDGMRMNALHLASFNGKTDVIDHLASSSTESSSSELDATAVYKLTPLHFAAVGNQSQAVLRLLHHGAEPTLRNEGRETPYDMAKDHGKPATYQILEEVTPKQARKRSQPRKKPAWKYDQAKSSQIIDNAIKEYGKAASKLSSKRFRDSLSQRIRNPEVRGRVEGIAEKLFGEIDQPLEDAAWVYRIRCTAMTDGQLLKRQKQFLPTGIFFLRSNWWATNGKTVDHFAILADNEYEAMAAIGVNGINAGLDTRRLLAWMMTVQRRHPFNLLSLGWDGFQFRLEGPVSDASEWADEILHICPPEDFEDHVYRKMKRQFRNQRPRVKLWWD